MQLLCKKQIQIANEVIKLIIQKMNYTCLYNYVYTHQYAEVLRLQEAMNTFDFDIIYKKGSEMPADYLSRNLISAISWDSNGFFHFVFP